MKTTLQTIRKYARKPDDIDTGKNDNESVFYYFGELLPEQWCDEVDRRIRHTGWFTNNDGTTYKDGTGKARGIVVSLPAVPGFPEGRFLAGYWFGGNDERVLWPEVYGDEMHFLAGNILPDTCILTQDLLFVCAWFCVFCLFCCWF